MAVFKILVSSATALAVALASVLPTAAARPALTRSDYEACQAKDEAGFKTAIAGITEKALQSGLARVDYNALVADQWRRVGLDGTVDRRVDVSVAEIIEETSFLDRLQSIGSTEKAKQIATAMAERVYRSDSMKSAIEALAVGVGKEIGRSIEIATLDAAEPTMQCLNAFLGPRYGSTVARVVTGDAGRLFMVDPTAGAGGVSTGAVVTENSEALAGTVLIIVRRQLANISQRIGQRIVGSVIGRLVSTVAGGVGVVLIAKDLWDFRNGVLPIIATEMKSVETKDKVRKELATILSEQIGEHTREISALTADRIIEIWRDFQRAHAKVLDLSERREPFRKFVDLTRPENLPRLDEVVGLVLAGEGEDGLLRRLDNGTLNQAVNQMPEAALEVARETRSVESALGWFGLAGAKLPAVVSNELHRRAKPSDFTRASLDRLLALEDKVAITRVASLTPDARAALFEVDDKELKALARTLGADELSQLARYLTGLERSASQRVLKSVALEPSKMQTLASSRVRDAVLASKDQLAAVTMLLRNDAAVDPGRMGDDFRLVLDGRVSPILLWDRHPVVIGAGLLACLMILVVLKRLVLGRRRPVVRAAA